MKKIFIDLLIACAVAGISFSFGMFLRSISTVDESYGPKMQIETVDGEKATKGSQENTEFEEYVLKKFDFTQENLSLLEHNTQEDRTKASLLIEQDTDNEYVYYMYAIECMWLETISSKGLYWCAEERIKHMLEEAANDDAKLFLVVGIGGSPSSPNSIHVIPIKFVHQRNLTANDVANYAQKNVNGFFTYETSTHMLLIK